MLDDNEGVVLWVLGFYWLAFFFFFAPARELS